MPTAGRVLIGVGLGVLVLWLALIVLLLIARPKGGLLKEAIRLAPDLIRLLTRLARDRSLPLGARVWLGLLLVYLASPVDLVPDFIPVVGYADDAIVVAGVLRMVVRRAGIGVVRRRWPGSPDGLAAVQRLAGLTHADDDQTRSRPTDSN